MAPKDQALVQQTLAGNREAFGDLVERYNGLVYGVIREKIRRSDEIEDLVQEVFCKAYEELAGLRDPARFAPWLARISTNVSIDWLRRQRQSHVARDEKTRLVALERQVRTPGEMLEESENILILWTALDRLGPELRRVVVLYHLEGCSQPDIARFLGVSLPTVRWRLMRARQKLGKELGQVLFDQTQPYPLKQQQVRNQVLAALPLVNLAHFEPPKSWFAKNWLRRLGLAAGGASLLGLLGVVAPDLIPPFVAGEWGKSDRDFRVSYRPMVLPDMAFSWEPQYPQQGEPVRIEVEGPSLTAEEAVELHYITDPIYPQDQVLAMTKKGDAWVAQVEVPAKATTVFFYATAAGEGPQDFDMVISRRHVQQLERYQWSFLVYGKEATPLPGAEYLRGKMAARLRRPQDQVLAHYDRELTLYPANIEVYPQRWYHLLWKAPHFEAGLSQVEAEKQALRMRYPDDPEVLWQAASFQTPSSADFYRTLYQRFPKSRHADAAMFAEAREYQTRRDYARQVAALKALVEQPQTNYADLAYRHLLQALVRVDTAAALDLAGALMTGRQHVPSINIGEDIERYIYMRSDLGGTTAKGMAYSLGIDLLLSRGNELQALQWVRELLASGLPDPLPYIYVGEKLFGRDTASLLDTPPSYPQNQSLALEVLAAGLPWISPEQLLDMPGYKTFYDVPEHMRDKVGRLHLDRVYSLRIRCLWVLGEGHLLRGDLHLAQQYLEEAATLQEEKRQITWAKGRLYGDIYMLLGSLYERLGQWNHAERMYRRPIGLFYSHPEAELSLARVNKVRPPEDIQPFVYPIAPGFSLLNALGREVHLAEYRGRTVLLYWGAVKTDYAQLLAQLARRFPDKLAVLYLSGDYATRDSLGHWVQNADLLFDLADGLAHPYEFLLDDSSIYRSAVYQPRGNTIYLIDPQGRLRLRQEWDTKGLPYRLEAQWEDQTARLEAKVVELVAGGGGEL
ncbi:MAG: sigma-70 family RNA polymerase sigma factor [Candidatus Latescibacteria bacterium]|nr:sigma-70 family RNA polymerase sigma factor [Candidatus Latescibacterota bacterium]